MLLVVAPRWKLIGIEIVFSQEEKKLVAIHSVHCSGRRNTMSWRGPIVKGGEPI